MSGLARPPFDGARNLTSEALPREMLPDGARSRFVENVNGLTVHLIEAGHERPGRPLVLLLHGFPELAYSWRHQLIPLAQAGYHVVAPDLRGFGRTSGWDRSYDCDLTEYGYLGKVRDALDLVRALGHDRVAAVVGHDLGAPIAAHCALIRPDVFRSAVLMSSPFAGVAGPGFMARMERLSADLAALPRPRKYYIVWNMERAAAADYDDPPQGMKEFFRAYFHSKSADWPGNRPVPLRAQSAQEMAQIPTYYVMDRDKGMAQTMLEYAASAQATRCDWLSEQELDLFAADYMRSGYQGALNAAYRPRQDIRNLEALGDFIGARIEVPACFVSGENDWGLYQTFGALDAMPETGCGRLLGCHIVPGAGHWVQQEKPDAVTAILLDFLREVR